MDDDYTVLSLPEIILSCLVLNWNRQNLVFLFFDYYDPCPQNSIPLLTFSGFVSSVVVRESGLLRLRSNAEQVFHSSPSRARPRPSIRNNISTDRTTMIDDSCAKLIIPATIKININFWPGEYVYDDRDQFQSSPPSFLGTYRCTSTGYWSTRVSSTDWLNVSDTSNNTSIGQRDILRSIRNLVVASL